MKHYLNRHQAQPAAKAMLAAGFGAAVAVIIVAGLSQITTMAMLFAPLGATCILLFSIPASPLSQPINVVGGHFISALIGVVGHFILPANFVLDGLVVGAALMAMMALRIVHPPAGATALVAYITATSWLFLAFPILLGSVVLVALATIYHRLTGTQYPLQALKI